MNTVKWKVCLKGHPMSGNNVIKLPSDTGRRCVTCYRAKKSRYTKSRYSRSPEKVLARHAVWYAVKTGKLKRFNCFVCNKKETSAHHVLGYAKENRLDVIWLCRKHHDEAHHA